VHRTLIRQLETLSLKPNDMPSVEGWQQLLAMVSESYQQTDEIGEGRSQLLFDGDVELCTRAKNSLEQRLRAILLALPDVLFLLDEDGRYLEIMAGSNEVLLYKKSQELKGRLLEDVLPAESSTIFLRVIDEALSSQSLQLLNYNLDTSLGKTEFEGRVVPTGFSLNGRETVVFLARNISSESSSQRTERLLDTVI